MTDLILTHEPPPETALETGYPESTLSLRLDCEGIGISWTLRGTDESMASRLPRVLSYLKRLQAKLPTARDPAVPQPPLEERDDWCSLHGKALVTQRNDRGDWKSHRTVEGEWCKGKPKRAGERAS